LSAGSRIHLAAVVVCVVVAILLLALFGVLVMRSLEGLPRLPLP
jgi:hypothetical protein